MSARVDVKSLFQCGKGVSRYERQAHRAAGRREEWPSLAHGFVLIKLKNQLRREFRCPKEVRRNFLPPSQICSVRFENSPHILYRISEKDANHGHFDEYSFQRI
jgi:hypothetical protein